MSLPVFGQIDVPPFSNREDFKLPLSVVDDDTDDPFNFAGITGSGTFSSWNVSVGGVVTTSNTTITIPQYPIGNQLSALALTVATGLSIAAGTPVKIYDTLTGANSLSGYVTSYSATTGALVVQIGVTFQFEIRETPPHVTNNFDYVWWWDPGTVVIGGALITASLGNGIMVTDLGVIQIRIPESQFKQLRHKTYLMGLTMFDGSDTKQLFVGPLSVLYGGVTN